MKFATGRLKREKGREKKTLARRFDRGRGEEIGGESERETKSESLGGAAKVQVMEIYGQGKEKKNGKIQKKKMEKKRTKST